MLDTKPETYIDKFPAGLRAFNSGKMSAGGASSYQVLYSMCTQVFITR
jgi:hypothetical protein